MATTCRELPRLLSPGVDTPSEEDSGFDREREKSSRSSAKRKSSSSKKDKGERALLSRARLVDQSGALMYAVANVFVRPDDPNALADEETRRCLQLIDEVFRLRSKWMDASYIDDDDPVKPHRRQRLCHPPHTLCSWSPVLSASPMT